VLLETGRPLLIPGSGTSATFIGGTVAIGWKSTPHAARAASAAMPFLARARDALVMSVEEGEPRNDPRRLVRNLSWHGLTAFAVTLTPDERGAAQTLLAAARDKAQLLVMGGYGHSRLREWIFGGFTQEVLTDAPLRC
jgi:nucleotide-binding universal stress UspA family protein